MVRSVLVDGADRGRVYGTLIGHGHGTVWLSSLVASRDGRSAFFVSRDYEQGDRAWRISLEDGRVTPLGTHDRWRQIRIADEAERAFCLHEEARLIRCFDAASGSARDIAFDFAIANFECSPDGRHLLITGAPPQGDRSAARRFVQRVDDGVAKFDVDATVETRFSDDSRALWLVADDRVERVSLDDRARRVIHLDTPVPKGSAFEFERGRARMVVNAARRSYKEPSELLVYDLEHGGAVKRFAVGYDALVRAVAGGEALVSEWSDKTGMLALRSLETGAPRALPCDPIAPTTLTVDGGAVIRARFSVIEVVDVATGAVRSWHDGHETTVEAVVWSRDGRLLASLGLRERVRVYDIDARALRWDLQIDRGGERLTHLLSPSSSLLFDRDGHTLHAFWLGGRSAWSMSTGGEIRRETSSESDLRCTMPKHAPHFIARDGRCVRAELEPSSLRLVDVDSKRDVLAASMPWASPGEVVSADPLRLRWKAWQNPYGWAVSVATFDERGAPTAAFTHILEHESKWIALDDDPCALVVTDWRHRGRIEIRDASGMRRVEGSPLLTHALAARGGVALFEIREPHGADPGRALVSLADGRIVARIPSTRALRSASFSPDGRHLAMVYRDGGVEVFALDGLTG